MKEMKMIWASVHEITDEQREELSEKGSVMILANDIPMLHKQMIDTPSERANVMMLVKNLINELILNYRKNIILVQPAGSLLFQHLLGCELVTRAMINQDVEDDAIPGVLYSYSKSISEDIPEKDGSITKISTFRHEKFI
jgi:hypothetical protein